ncbi:MAG: HAD-IIIA family hydrolase [Taibaiella sp.]|jgi:D-glycero-D-manno-heptose 1,7-bisphosphate phosphatase|nr:HAD-IIIA family hydrolase [Taibaiella sp.]
MNLTDQKPEIDKSWTLFLDRDGVINVESVGSYITSWSEFNFHDGAQDAIRSLSRIFGTIVVVSNQRGVGRGIMTIDALREINTNMRATVAEYGGRIDKVYNCTAVSDDDRNRKPNTGMGLQAQEDFPAIDFKRSIMVGNSMSDMEFGKKLSMHTIFLTTKHDPVTLPHDLIDEQYESLQAWVRNMVPAEMVG